MIRLAVRAPAHTGFCEFREPDGEIDIGVGVISRPPDPARVPPNGRIHTAAAGEPTVKAFDGGLAQRRPHPPHEILSTQHGASRDSEANHNQREPPNEHYFCSSFFAGPGFTASPALSGPFESDL